MRPEYLLAAGLVLLVLWAVVDTYWRKDWPTSWLEVEEPEPPPPTYTHEPNYNLREMPSWDEPAAKGLHPDSRRAPDHQATVLQFLSKRGVR